MQTFQKCLNLESVSFQEPSNLRKIGEQSFSNCINLKTIELPSQVKEIASYSFEGCTKLESLIILSNISEIKDYAFFDCSNLSCISYYGIDEPIVSQNAFQGCNKLDNIFTSLTYSSEKIGSFNVTKISDISHVCRPIDSSNHLKIACVVIFSIVFICIILYFTVFKRMKNKKQVKKIHHKY